MKKLLSFLYCFAIFCSANSQTHITLNADLGETTISRHIYGHFSEHLGRCIYDGFYVGDNSKIPNTDGVRKDIIEALKKLKVPNLRWPGGCFADTYHWKDGIGPLADRPTIINTWWGGVTEDNSFGTHNFLNLCEELGTEPYITGNVGSGTVQELSDWVQYVNFEGKNSPMSKLRNENGRAAPWKVRYWGVGNEAWGCGGNMTPEYYANEYRKYATFMTASWGDEKIFRIASGASDADYRWTEVLMREIPLHLIEGLAMHHYSVIDWNKKSSATNFTEAEYFTTMKKAIEMDELITRHAAIMDRYDPKKKVAMVIDEWGGWYDVEPGTNGAFLFQQNTMRDAMIAGVTLNIFNNHSERVRFAELAQTVNVLQAVILTEGEKILLTPTYHVMEMYNVHQDATLLPLNFKTPMYSFDKEQLAAISASASKDKNGVVHISLTNIDAHKAQDITLDIRGGKFNTVNGRIISSGKLQDYNSFDNPEKIKPILFKGAVLSNNELKLQLPPFSVVVLELK